MSALRRFKVFLVDAKNVEWIPAGSAAENRDGSLNVFIGDQRFHVRESERCDKLPRQQCRRYEGHPGPCHDGERDRYPDEVAAAERKVDALEARAKKGGAR